MLSTKMIDFIMLDSLQVAFGDCGGILKEIGILENGINLVFIGLRE